MNTVQLAQTLSRHLSVTDLAALESDKALEFIDAINYGIQTFFEAAPNSYSRTTLSHTVFTPDTVQIGVTRGSNEISTDAFLDTQRGSSIVINGDEKVNEITGNNLLLHDYTGTTGTQSATIWYDAVAVVDFLILEVVTEPQIVETGKRLRFLDTTGSNHYQNPRYLSTTDYPEYYSLEHVGGSLDAETDAVFQLRFVPRPTRECTLKFDAHILPVAYGITELTTPKTLPIANSLVSRLLVPLIEGRLAESTLWNDSSDRNVAQARATAQEQRIRQLPAYFARRKGRVRTKRGW